MVAKKKLLSWIGIAVVNLALLELLCWAVYALNPAHVLAVFYYPEIFKDVTPMTYSYGWEMNPTNKATTRAVPNAQKHACGAAFGDSFTHGDEVGDAETWAYLASQKIGCDIANYGVGGFGTDQTYLKYHALQPQADFVVIGIYQEMLRRNLAASWLFYGERTKSSLKPMFVVKDKQLVQVPPPDEMTLTKVQKYHQHDHYYAPYRMRFPYSWSMMKALYYRVDKSAFKRLMLSASDAVYTDKKSLQMERLLLDKMVSEIQASGKRPVFLFFPAVSDAMAGHFYYTELKKTLAETYPDLCMIDPGPALYQAHMPLKAPQGHYTAEGHAIMAEVVANQLQECGLVKAK